SSRRRAPAPERVHHLLVRSRSQNTCSRCGQLIRQVDRATQSTIAAPVILEVKLGLSALQRLIHSHDEVIKIRECFSYNPEYDGDPVQEKGAIWSFYYFFYNRKLKPVVSFRCSRSSAPAWLNNKTFQTIV
ncbi:unnamed protein product, partial [Urochloa humidicola]